VRNSIPPCTVFLSSAFKGLQDTRATIRNKLLSKGFHVWWAEDHPYLRDAAPEVVRAACFAGLEASSVYLGILSARYGSDPLGLAFTELEYHQSVRLNLPRFVYVLSDSRTVARKQRERQNGFKLLVEDGDISLFSPRRVKSVNHLIEQIASDFDPALLASLPARITTEDATCIKNIRLVSDRLCQCAYGGDIRDAASILRRQAKSSLDAALPLGLIFFQHFFSHAQWRQKRYLSGLDNLLASWSDVAAWKGIEGALGQTNIAKARIVLNQMIGNFKRIPILATAVASGLYSDRRLFQARKWCDLVMARTPVEWLHGPIELTRGNIGTAKKTFAAILRKPNQSPNWIALHLAYYGLCQVKEGNRNEGIKHITESLSDQSLEATTRTRVARSLAEAHLTTGAWDEAQSRCMLAETIAAKHGLTGQVGKAKKLHKRITVLRRRIGR
jgi:hypothetical protein